MYLKSADHLKRILILFLLQFILGMVQIIEKKKKKLMKK